MRHAIRHRLVGALVCAALLALPQAGAGQSSQIELLVSRELPRYGFDVDVADLNSTQLHAIYGAMHRPMSHSERRAQIRSVLGGSYSLRGFLFGN